MPIKHYSKSELEVLFRESGLSVAEIEKVEYDWYTEIKSRPTKMNDSYPWDWLVEYRKE